MPHEILSKQNDDQHILLLRASASAYKNAKKGEIFITVFILFLAVAYPISYVFLKDETAKLILFGCSFSITIIIQILSGILRDNTSKGAIFKEVFDTSVFGLQWKSTLKKPDTSDVIRYSKKYRGGEIRDWYSVNLSSSVPGSIAVAVFQHTNTNWDIQLRRKYRKWLVRFLLVYSIALLILMVVMKVDALTIFLILFSLLLFYNHFINLIRGHGAAIHRRDSISKHLDIIIQKKKEVSITELRDVQDEIYYTRQESAKVPNFFFNWYKRSMNDDAEDFIKSVNRIYET